MQLDSFIADQTLKALSFSHDQNPSRVSPAVSTAPARERRARIVQVLHAHLYGNDCPPYLIISDGANCVHLFVPSLFFYDDESMPARDVQQHLDSVVFGSTRNKASINRGALIKIRNYTILTISQCCKDYLSKIQYMPNSRSTSQRTLPIHPTVCWAIVGCRFFSRTDKDKADKTLSSHLPLIQVLGCDGSDIFDNPLDVHENIDVRRVNREQTYDAMCQRLLACHGHYSSSLIPDSFLEWPCLLQRNRINVISSELGRLQEQIQPEKQVLNQKPSSDSNTHHDCGSHSTATGHGINNTKILHEIARHGDAINHITRENKDSDLNDEPFHAANNNDIRDDDTVAISSGDLVNTSEQESLLSIYRSFELSEIAVQCYNMHDQIGCPSDGGA